MIVKFFQPQLKFSIRTDTSLCVVLLVSFISLSCNNPFQPEEQYAPELNIYSVLCANANVVYVKVGSVVKSPSDALLQTHGAVVTLVQSGANGSATQTVTLTDSTAVIDGDTASFYYAPVHIIPGASYSVFVAKDGYPSVSAAAQIPFGSAAIPDQDTYSILQNPKDVKTDISLSVNLSGTASATLVQMFVECRGLDDSGNFTVGSFNVIPVDSLNPFTEIDSPTFQINVDTAQYKSAFKLASQYATNLRHFHLYAVIIVSQIDDNLYRFFITSTHSADPLLLRTDKIIFTNIFNNAGTGIVAGVSVDTTRIFLY